MPSFKEDGKKLQPGQAGKQPFWEGLLRKALVPFPVSPSNGHIRPVPAIGLQTGKRAQPRKPAESASPPDFQH